MKSISSYFLLLFLVCGNSNAQTPIDRIQLGMTASTNSSFAYSFEASCHYMLLPSIGVGCGAGFFNQWYSDYSPHGETSDKWTSWRVSDADKKVSKLYLQPSILLKSPKIFSIGKYDFSFQVEPGLKLTLPYAGLHINYKNVNTNNQQDKYVSTYKGNWCFWELKSCIRMSVDDVSLAIGYGLSNLDIYSSRRNLSVGNTSFNSFYPKENTHSLFINLGYSF